MSLSDAERAMQSIEGLGARFDEAKALNYVALVKEFLSRARRYCESQGLPLATPFIDPTEGLRSTLPEPLERRLRDWAEGTSDLSPAVKQACRNHIRYLAYREDLPPAKREGADIYSPLIDLLSEGGDFYLHHGAICVRDLAMIPLARH
jgi:hypothetical protein